MSMRQNKTTLPALAGASPRDSSLLSTEPTCDDRRTTLARSSSRKEQGMPRRRRQIVIGVVTVASVVLALLAGVVVAPRPAHAAQVSISQVRAETAFAGFESTDSTGCILTTVFLLGTNGDVLIPPGGPQAVPAIVVEISQSNVCTSTLLLEATGLSSVIDFHLAGDLSTATLAASRAVMHDVLTDITFDVDVNVTWDGTGSVTRHAGTSHFRAPGMVMNAVEVGFTRAAQATGTIVSGTTNYIPRPSSVGEVQDATSGQITVTMP